jgi:hypothetical protein
MVEIAPRRIISTAVMDAMLEVSTCSMNEGAGSLGRDLHINGKRLFCFGFSWSTTMRWREPQSKLHCNSTLIGS